MIRTAKPLSRPAKWLIFEDAHWNDPTSIEALNAVIENVQRARVLAVITYRPEFKLIYRRGSLPEMAADLVRNHVAVIATSLSTQAAIAVPIQFLENNPRQSSLWVRFMCPQTRRNWLRLPIVRFHPGSSCPQQPP
jgi:hypothetical protein